MNTISYKNYCNTAIKQRSIYFKKEETPVVNNFINEVNKLEEQRLEGNKFSKLFRSKTASLISGSLMLIGELALFLKFKKMPNEQFRQHFLKYFIGSFGILGGGFALKTGLTKLFEKSYDKNLDKIQKTFDEINTDTSARLSEKHFSSSYLGGTYVVANGKIELNKNEIADPIGVRSLKKILLHELEHAKQFELIACSDNGIEKLNYGFLKGYVDAFKKDENAIAELYQIRDEINNDDLTYVAQGTEINLKKYANAIIMLLENENTPINELPIVIDAEHYQKVREKRGELTNEEKEQADKYYEAYLNYTGVTALNAYNPFGKYRKNDLEKEAYNTKNN